MKTAYDMFISCVWLTFISSPRYLVKTVYSQDINNLILSFVIEIASTYALIMINMYAISCKLVCLSKQGLLVNKFEMWR